MAVLDRAAGAVAAAVARTKGGETTGMREGQYDFDVAADEAALAVLTGAGFGVYSEESGWHDADREMVVVLDPVDGSTNAARGLPWVSTSLCVVDSEGMLAALVQNLVNGRAYRAIRGRGSTVDGRPLVSSAGPGNPWGSGPSAQVSSAGPGNPWGSGPSAQVSSAGPGNPWGSGPSAQVSSAGPGNPWGSGPSAQESLAAATVGLTGLPPRNLGWGQYRSMGSIALDLCAVAEGVLDAYIDCTPEGHATWDYLGGILVCDEAGVAVDEARGCSLLPDDLAERRLPVAAATDPLLFEVLVQRRKF